MSIEIGDQAPNFTTVNEANEEVTLADYKGKKVILVFYPFDFSGICQGELCDIRDNYSAWMDNNAEVLGISRDSRFAHAAFKKQEGFPFSLLADTKGIIAQEYGVWNEALAAAERMTVVIDEKGIVIFKIHNGIPDARDHSGVLEAITS